MKSFNSNVNIPPIGHIAQRYAAIELNSWEVHMSNVSKRPKPTQDDRFQCPLFRAAVRLVLEHYGQSTSYKSFKKMEAEFNSPDWEAMALDIKLGPVFGIARCELLNQHGQVIPNESAQPVILCQVRGSDQKAAEQQLTRYKVVKWLTEEEMDDLIQKYGSLIVREIPENKVSYRFNMKGSDL